jgi:hypothetical protein
MAIPRVWTSAGLREEASSRKSGHQVESDVGRRRGNNLVYARKVDHGFDKKSAADLRNRRTPLIRKTQPYNELQGRHWFLPQAVKAFRLIRPRAQRYPQIRFANRCLQHLASWLP